MADPMKQRTGHLNAGEGEGKAEKKERADDKSERKRTSRRQQTQMKGGDRV